MKKVLAVGLFAALSLTLTASSQAGVSDDDKTTISEFCSTRNDLGLSHGACVAYFVTHNVVPHDASVCKNEGLQELMGVDTRGQCVKKLGVMHQ